MWQSHFTCFTKDNLTFRPLFKKKKKRQNLIPLFDFKFSAG